MRFAGSTDGEWLYCGCNRTWHASDDDDYNDDDIYDGGDYYGHHDDHHHHKFDFKERSYGSDYFRDTLW